MMNYVPIVDEHESLAADAQEVLDERRQVRVERTYEESKPYTEEALAYLKAQGYSFYTHDLQGHMWRCVMDRPANAHGLSLRMIRDEPDEQEGFTRLAIDALGNLRIWHEQQQQQTA